MNKNPFISFVALILLAAIIVLVLASCAVPEVEGKTPERFTLEVAYRDPFMYLYIITDTETGIQYLFAKNGDGCGLTVLLEGGEEDE